MKKAILVHCWTGYPEYCWYPYVRQELTKKGYKVLIPFFPDVFPLLGKWLQKIQKAVGDDNSETILIGHSLGAIAVLKYLQALPAEEKVGGVVLVAGFMNDLGFKPLHNFFEEPLDFEKIKNKADEFVMVASSDDPYIKPHHTMIMKDKLSARIIWIAREHFTENKEGLVYKKFPEVISAIEKIERNHVKQTEDREWIINPALAGLNI